MPLKKISLKNSRLYLVLDKDVCGQKIKSILARALKGGVDIVQYRDKNSSVKNLITHARPLLALCRHYHVPFIINDSLAGALALDCDGLHVGQDDAPVSLVRRVLGKNKLIGLSCHTLEQIKKAQREDVDYLGFGPIFNTLTKPEASPRGIETFRRSLRVSRWPIFAIGGISKENLNKFSGITHLRIACIREICCAHNPTIMTRQLKERLHHV